MIMTSGAQAGEILDGSRGERTRSAILDASRRLFLERGYTGTPINAITEACGISRAGFYTYFKDKREIFNVLGETAYYDALAVMGLLDQAWYTVHRQTVAVDRDEMIAGTDAGVTPALNLTEAVADPHPAARGVHVEWTAIPSPRRRRGSPARRSATVG